MAVNATINEIFDSIQGEGPYIGYRQIFIRFCGCNLYCDYCDTDFEHGDEYTVDKLIAKINSYNLPAVHSISLTGGEPLMHQEFLHEFLPQINKKIYLETNGIMFESLARNIDFIDIISMDIKLNSSAKIGDIFNKHEKFIEIAKNAEKEIFAKIVFDETIQRFEIDESVRLAKKYDIPLILQPKMNGKKIAVSHEKILEIFEKFTGLYPQTRLIGQVHKFFDIR